MHSKLVFIFILLFSFVSVKAQYFNAGIKAGIVGSQVDGDGFSGYDKLGFEAGIFVNYQLSKLISMQLEMEIIQKGSSHTPNYEKGDFDQYKMRVNYIQVPVLFQYKITKKITGESGPAFGLLVSDYEQRDQYEITSNPFRKFSFSWVTGINYAITDNWAANFRFDYSLMGIRKKPAPGDRRFLLQYGQFHNVLVISIQYIISHAKEK